MAIRFENPPINELVIGTFFNPIPSEFRTEHIGAFWSSIRDTFPNIEQKPPIATSAMFEETLGAEFFPMPRYWLSTEDEVNLIQIQKNAFLMNWRRRDSQYPHFDQHLKPRFDEYYQKFIDFLASVVGISDTPIDLCDLTYINMIYPCEYWNGPQDTHKVISAFNPIDISSGYLNDPAFNNVFVHPIDETLELKVTIKNGKTADEGQRPVLIFEIKVSGRLGGAAKSEADEWFKRGHDVIIECFLRITNQEIRHMYWGPQPGGTT